MMLSQIVTMTPVVHCVSVHFPGDIYEKVS